MISLSYRAIVLACGIGTVAVAIDIPPGGDAIYYQLRASTEVVIAQLVTVDARGHHFQVTETLRGSAPPRFVEPDTILRSLNLQTGQSFLLYLRKPTTGGVRLATSIYSIQRIEAMQDTAYRTTLAAYIANLQSKGALKPVLLARVSHQVPYIQYSAVADLKRLHLLTDPDVVDLGRRLQAGQIVDPRARTIIIQELGRRQIRTSAGTLEGIARDRRQPVAVRGAAIDALVDLRAIESLRALGPVIEREGSIVLKRKLIQEAPRRLQQ
jgi:hypothetical protein